MSDRYLIVGLGNPGRQYVQTRHNVGFWVVSALAQRHGLDKFRTERRAMVTDGTIKGQRVLLAMPQTYMNLSGEAVRALMDFYKIPIEHFIVVHDDLDLPLGTLRLRSSGGHGGQNGIRNIIHHLGTQNFARVRFGIDRPPGRMQPRDYVLQPFHGDDRILADQVTDHAADAIEFWLKSGVEAAMSRFNGNVNEPAPEPAPDPREELAVAQRAHELKPDDVSPLTKMAKLYKRLGKMAEAMETHLRLAELHEGRNDLNAMIVELERASSIDPARTDLQEAIANAYEVTGNTKRAAGRWIKLAEYYLSQDKPEAALRAVEAALSINPQHPRALELQASLESER